MMIITMKTIMMITMMTIEETTTKKVLMEEMPKTKFVWSMISD